MYRWFIICGFLACAIGVGAAQAQAQAPPRSERERTCLIASLELRLDGLERRRRWLERRDDDRTLWELRQLREGQLRILDQLRALRERPGASPLPAGPWYILPPAASPLPADPWRGYAPAPGPLPADPWRGYTPRPAPWGDCPMCPPAPTAPAPRTDDDLSRGQPAPGTAPGGYHRYTRRVRPALWR